MAGPLFRITRFDVRLFFRALALAGLALAVALLVTAATDEGDVLFWVRAGRALPAAPACSAIGAWLALRPARARGEERALEALGRSPFRIHLPAALGAGALACAAGLAIVAVAAVDVEVFYPSAAPVDVYRFDGDGFVNRTTGTRFRVDGSFVPFAVPAEPRASSGEPGRSPPHGRGAAAFATALAGFAFSLVATRGARGERVLPTALVVTTVAASVVLFHAAAAGRSSAWFSVLPPTLLLVVGAFRYGASPWTETKRA